MRESEKFAISNYMSDLFTLNMLKQTGRPSLQAKDEMGIAPGKHLPCDVSQ